MIETILQNNENLALLFDQMAAVFDSVSVLADPPRVIVYDIDATQGAIDTIISAHNPNEQTQNQQIEQVAANAKSQAANIPGWATWDEATALAWFDTNIADNLPVANLAAANAVLADMATMQRAMVRMIIALRNATWSDLQE